MAGPSQKNIWISVIFSKRRTALPALHCSRGVVDIVDGRLHGRVIAAGMVWLDSLKEGWAPGKNNKLNTPKPNVAWTRSSSSARICLMSATACFLKAASSILEIGVSKDCCIQVCIKIKATRPLRKAHQRRSYSGNGTWCKPQNFYRNIS